MSLSDHFRNSARIDALRPDAGDDGTTTGSAGLPLRSVQPVVATLGAGEDRPACFAAADDKNRLSVAKLIRALGWDAKTPLVASFDRSGLVPAIVVRPGAVTAPTQHALTLDTAGRLRLAPTLRASLQVSAGEQVLVIAAPEPQTAGPAGQLVLLAHSTAIAALTQTLLIAPAPAAARDRGCEVPEQPDRPTRRTTVKKAWTAPAA